MAFFEPARPAPFGALTVYRMVDLLDQVRMTYNERKLAKATERSLSRLSDRELDDIGLHRGTIEQVSGAIAHR